MKLLRRCAPYVGHQRYFHGSQWFGQLWNCSGTALGLCSGTALTSRWCTIGTRMIGKDRKVLLCSSGNVLSLLWCCSGDDLITLWKHAGIALMLYWNYAKIAWKMLVPVVEQNWDFPYAALRSHSNWSRNAIKDKGFDNVPETSLKLSLKLQQ